MTPHKITWGWVLFAVLIKAKNWRGARYWALRKLMQDGWIKGAQTCPRRGEGPQYDQEMQDWWDRKRWGWTWSRKLRYWYYNGWPGDMLKAWEEFVWAKWRAQNMPYHGFWYFARMHLPRTLTGGTTWEWPWQPRTCSYCGGVHPEDATRLVEEGWILDATTKSYKRYMSPPPVSYQAFEEAYPNVHANLCHGHQAEHKGERIPVHSWYPVPPVKLYVMHFSDAQIGAVNHAVKTQREQERAAAYNKAMDATMGKTREEA